MLKMKYRKYPKIIEAIMRRHDVYNKQLELCEKLEREGKALIIRPEEKLSIDKFSKNASRIVKLYDEGIIEGRLAVKMMKRKWKL